MTSDGVWNYSYDLRATSSEKDFIGTSERWNYAYRQPQRIDRSQASRFGRSIDLTAELQV